MKIERIPNIEPEKKEKVILKVAGNVMEIRYSKTPGGSPIKKLSKDYGMDVRTGEMVEYKHKENRAGDMASVSQSLKRLRDILNANLKEPENALWVTLTYAENMRDEKKLYADFHAFWKRFQRFQKQKGQTQADYIACGEPQGRGAWHLHVVLLFDEKAPYIPNADMARLWGHGFTKVKSFNSLGNPGLYLTAYLGDMELMEAVSAGALSANVKEVEVTGEDGERQKKSIIKGARLHLYPPGFNIYRTSRGIKRPQEYEMTEEEAQEVVGDAPLTYEKTVAVKDESGAVKNVVNYRTYTRGAEKGGNEKVEKKE